MTWDQRFLDLAHHVATWSKDPSTKVGAVLVGTDKRQVALGYNGFPRGIADSTYRLADRDSKLRYTIHAERNVLDNAHFPTQGATLYCTHPPCTSCALSIISKGIHRVVSSPMSSEFASRWGAETFLSRDLFREAGVVCNF
jgi:dCMP deaminase